MLETTTIANRIYNDPRAAAEMAARMIAITECQEQIGETRWWQVQKRMRLYNRMKREAAAIRALLHSFKGQHQPEKPF